MADESKTNSFAAELIATANAIAAPGKGILAADESTGTIGKRFAGISVENNRDNRRRYRQMLFTTKGLGKFISGAICYEETLFETTPDGRSFVSLLQAEGIIPGIKVDKGQKPIPYTDGEMTTQGLDDLDKRCAKYYAAGARFAKWRGTIKISDAGAPTENAIQQTVQALARYASICQENGLVPIVEPEVLMDGTHSIERSAEITERVLAAQYKALSDQKVLLEGSLLKPNMVRTGADAAEKASMAEVGRATVRVLQHTVPVAVPGITFLSGGMSEEEATVALNAINSMDAKKPWSLTFSYGRALQQSVLKAWKGSDDNIVAAQTALLIRAEANSKANLGTYAGEASGAGVAGESLHVKNYVY